MTYSCGYFGSDSDSLEDAQQNKLRMICEKLDLQPGETLLDIGCGFGGLAIFAAQNYGARVFAITNSKEHFRVARARSKRLASVEVALMDYRDLATLGRRFDKIASIEMVEAVGPKNYSSYMSIAHDCLLEGGRFLIQSFVSNTSLSVCNEWFDRYIFPNGVSPSFAQLTSATEGNFGAPKDVHDIGAHYVPTLLAWDRNLRASRVELEHRYNRRFFRTWHFYLTCLAGVFRAESLRLCQIVFARGAIGDVRAADRVYRRVSSAPPSDPVFESHDSAA
jgi:cyclopropane-fatty-acyl-phospholipid synthase